MLLYFQTGDLGAMSWMVVREHFNMFMLLFLEYKAELETAELEPDEDLAMITEIATRNPPALMSVITILKEYEDTDTKDKEENNKAALF